MSITLYHCHQSRSMRCLWMLNELGLEYDLKTMPFGPALRDPEYLAVHPLGRVPCLVDGDLIHGQMLTQQYVVIQDEAQRSPLLQKLETRRLEKCLEVLDDALAGRDYLLASGFTAVDVANGFSLYMGQHFTGLGNYSNVSAYFERLKARPAFQASEPAPDEPLRVYTQDRYGEFGR